MQSQLIKDFLILSRLESIESVLIEMDSENQKKLEKYFLENMARLQAIKEGTTNEDQNRVCQ